MARGTRTRQRRAGQHGDAGFRGHTPSAHAAGTRAGAGPRCSARNAACGAILRTHLPAARGRTQARERGRCGAGEAAVALVQAGDRAGVGHARARAMAATDRASRERGSPVDSNRQHDGAQRRHSRHGHPGRRVPKRLRQPGGFGAAQRTRRAHRSPQQRCAARRPPGHHRPGSGCRWQPRTRRGDAVRRRRSHTLAGALPNADAMGRPVRAASITGAIDRRARHALSPEVAPLAPTTGPHGRHIGRCDPSA